MTLLSHLIVGTFVRGVNAVRAHRQMSIDSNPAATDKFVRHDPC